LITVCSGRTSQVANRHITHSFFVTYKDYAG
jgi:hypothetical protein